MVTLAADPARPRLILTSARAMLERVPPAARWADASLTVAVDEPVDGHALAERLHGWGYLSDEHVDEPGQVAARGNVVDVFPGNAATPMRLVLEEGKLLAIHGVDPVTQRSDGMERTALTIHPVVEVPMTAAMTDPDATAGLVCLLDYLPGAILLLHDEVETRWNELWEQVEDAHGATLRARRTGDDGDAYVPPPARLFCSPDELVAAVAKQGTQPADRLGLARTIAPVHGTAAVAAAIHGAAEAGRVVVAAGPDAARLHGALTRRKGIAVALAKDWADALTAPAGVSAIVPMTLETGFARDGLTVLAVPAAAARRGAARLLVEEPPRIDDIMVHREHGICRLRGLTPVATEDRVVLEFADDTELLVPTAELDQLWRYGSEAGPIALDKVGGASWHRRRDEIAVEIAATARELGAASAARAKVAAPVIVPHGPAYARFVRRFTFPLSPDQADAIDATLADLAAGRPMDRLVCGDVGFGKTEVALRAAAAVALAGHQVAVVAPTTVLARQHADNFARRFAGLGVRVAIAAARGGGRPVRAGLADGSIGIVVGTQAHGGRRVQFKNLALVVIDEEQRFGDAHKKRLAGLRNPAGGVHCLMMSATPIPRTLQGAMVGLRQVSVIATAAGAPAADPHLRAALGSRRGARSPAARAGARRPELRGLPPDRGPGRHSPARLAELAPELSVVTAHGKLQPAALEQMVAEFTAGQHDVLLATNIIEAGLDIPRANTILVTRRRPLRPVAAAPDARPRRPGGAARRGLPVDRAGQAARSPRPSAACARWRPRPSWVPAWRSAWPTWTRAAPGDLFGERQAGHVRAIGTELYQQLLADELAASHGDAPCRICPDVKLDVAARLPAELVPEPNLRLELYRRLARFESPAQVADFADELADRFGELPNPVLLLLSVARLRTWCARARRRAVGCRAERRRADTRRCDTRGPPWQQDLASWRRRRARPRAARDRGKAMRPHDWTA